MQRSTVRSPTVCLVSWTSVTPRNFAHDDAHVGTENSSGEAPSIHVFRPSGADVPDDPSPSTASSRATAASYTRAPVLFSHLLLGLSHIRHGSNQPSGRGPARSSSAAPRLRRSHQPSPASPAGTRRQHCRPKQTSSPRSAQPRMPSRASGTRRQRF